MNQTVDQIARFVGGAVVGDPTVRITGVNGIKQAKPGELSFLENPRYLPFLEGSEASAVFVTPGTGAAGKTLIEVQNPYHSFLSVVREYRIGEPAKLAPGIHALAAVGSNTTFGRNVAVDAFVRIGNNCAIGDEVSIYGGCYISDGSVVGAGTILYPNVVLRENTVIGARCIIHAGAMLGSDGFGFIPQDTGLYKVPQTGNVVLGDEVEIGSNTAVDRATFGSTVIGRGTKIDNLCQIGHNVELGEHCVVSGMSGIAGSTKVGRRVTIAAQVGIIDHLEIGDGAIIAARAGVATNIAPGAVVSGFPAINHKSDMRILGTLRRLPDMAHRVRELEQRIKQLEEQLHGKATDNCQ